jgi:hypothetical protein
MCKLCGAYGYMATTVKEGPNHGRDYWYCPNKRTQANPTGCVENFLGWCDGKGNNIPYTPPNTPASTVNFAEEFDHLDEVLHNNELVCVSFDYSGLEERYCAVCGEYYFLSCSCTLFKFKVYK